MLPHPPAELWCPPALRTAAQEALNIAYATNRMVAAAHSQAITDDLTNIFLDLASASQKARKSLTPVVVEFIAARARLGGEVPTWNGMSDSCFTGLANTCAADAVDAFCVPYDTGLEWGRFVYLSPKQITEEVRRGILDRFQTRTTLDTDLLRVEIDRELREASRLSFANQIASSKSDSVALPDAEKFMLQVDSASIPPAAPASGFVSADELANILNVHPSRKQAFVKRIERHRRKLGDQEWKEIDNSSKNMPKYLYRADSPAIVLLGAAYIAPKPS